MHVGVGVVDVVLEPVDVVEDVKVELMVGLQEQAEL